MESTMDAIKGVFLTYKKLGEGAMNQLTDQELFQSPSKESNSIAVIVKHLWGNMRSRWTDFLHSDGEKSWRLRDTEFADDITERSELMAKWEEGWKCVFDALDQVSEDMLQDTVYIRKEPHTILKAIHRQVGHYAYHVGQMVFLAKMYRDTDWTSLSIPRGQSDAFNKKMGH